MNLLTQKATAPTVIALFAGVAIGIFITVAALSRYNVKVTGNYAIMKCDRLTGRTWVSQRGENWQELFHDAYQQAN